MSWEIRQGDALERLREMPDRSVQMCITSPPYYGLRDYGTAVWEGGDEGCEHRGRDARTTGGTGASSKKQNSNFGSTVYSGDCICGARRVDRQIGLEQTPEEYVARLVDVFREVRRVLRDDGTCWVNLGDSYASGGRTEYDADPKLPQRGGNQRQRSTIGAGLKPKDLIGIPWMVAFALRADGWYLRSDIIWAKNNPMPESVTDRPTKAHEYVFLLTKSERYYYDAEAIKEPMADSSITRLSQPTLDQQEGSHRVHGKTNGTMKAVGHLPKQDELGKRTYTGFNARWDARVEPLALRNKRSVWTVNTQPCKEAHFATWPPKLVEIMVKAGSKEGDTVLDPFNGAATTGLVALNLGRKYLGIELNPEYIEISRKRLDRIDAYQPGLFAEVAG